MKQTLLLVLLALLVLAVPVKGIPPPSATTPPAVAPVQDAQPAIPVREGPISTPVIQPIGKGEVDWSYQTIRATGMSVIDTTLPQPQRLPMAIRGAKVDAQRNLLETIKGVRVVSETKVVDLALKSDYILTQLDGVIKGAVMVGEPSEKNGYVEVTMEVPMYDKNGIAPPIADEVIKTQPTVTEAPLTEVDKKSIDATSGVVFDLSSTSIKPEMFPNLVDGQGNVLLDMVRNYKNLGPDALKKFQYVKSIEDVLNNPQLRSNPTVIKIVEAAKNGWVVAQKDVQKVSWVSKGLDILLKVGKVLMMFL